MSKTVWGLGAAIILASLWIAVAPDQLVSIMDWESRRGLLTAAGIRVVTGLLLIVSASSSRYPKGLKIFGGLVLVAGLLLPFLPIEMWSALLGWWFVEHQGAYRVVGGVGGVLFGAFFIHAARPGTGASSQAAAGEAGG